LFSSTLAGPDPVAGAADPPRDPTLGRPAAMT